MFPHIHYGLLSNTKYWAIWTHDLVSHDSSYGMFFVMQIKKYLKPALFKSKIPVQLLGSTVNEREKGRKEGRLAFVEE